MTLDFGETEEEQRIVMRTALQRLYGDFYGNGKQGLLDEVRTFTSEFRGAEAERAKQHNSNRARLNLIIALLAMIAAYIAIFLTLRPGRVATALHTTLPPTYAAER